MLHLPRNKHGRKQFFGNISRPISGATPHGLASPEEAIRVGFRALELGASSVYCSASPFIIEAMAREGIPVVGHLGMVPRHALQSPSMASADSVRTHSAELKKELGLGDLVLTQILYVVGSHWVGTAAKLGASQIVFWLLALLFFYAPLAAVVIHLNRAMPLEGGLYQWAKLGFNDFIGFLVGWNLWLYIIVFMSSQGMAISTNIAYAIGFDWLGGNKWFILAVTIALVTFLIAVTVLGLSVGKWFQNAGGVAQIIVTARNRSFELSLKKFT